MLLDADGNVLLTDFGLSKEGVSDNISAHSFCGTPEYLAPEILTRQGHGRAADWWSLGAILYEMVVGMPPFYSRQRDRLFQKILSSSLRMPRSLSDECRHLLMCLLDRNPNTRIGSRHDAMEVSMHASTHSTCTRSCTILSLSQQASQSPAQQPASCSARSPTNRP